MTASVAPRAGQNEVLAGTHVNVAERSLLFDVVKGLAISLVALGHTNQGELNRGWWGSSPFGLDLNAFIYAFHMPAFFFVAGYFIPASLSKRGPRKFTLQKVRTIFWPFFFWSLILPFEPVFLGRFMHEAVPSLRLILLNLVTGSMDWFLMTLFVTSIVAIPLVGLPMAPAFLASVAASYFWHPIYVAGVDQTIHHLPFVIAGMWASKRPLRWERMPAWVSLTLGVMAGVGVAAFCSLVKSPAALRLASVPLGLTGTASLLLLGHAMGNSWLARMTAWVGVGSFGVFIFAPFPQGAGRELLKAAHVTQPVVQLLLPTLLAILLPAWMYQKRERLGIGWTFAFPQRQRGAVSLRKRPSRAQ